MPTHCKPPRLPAWAAAVVLAGGAQGGLAQEAGHSIEVIGVSPVPGLGVTRDRVPAHVQSADAQALERSQAADLTGFINRRLGSVHLNEVQNNPFQPDVQFRGFTASPLLGSPQGLSVYLDGVRLNQPFGDVVSWDLIPKVAINTVTLMPGSNPLFGLNTLGGALAVQTKDGRHHPGTSLQVGAGSYGRRAAEFETGGVRASDGLHWYAAANRFHEHGWRDDSPSEVTQLFGKLGRRDGDTDVALSLAAARTDLRGNGMQEQTLLAQEGPRSIYTRPDDTHNRAALANLTARHTLSDGWTVSGQAYWRRIRTRTLNGDLNDDALGQNLYQPNAAERAALAGAGYTGFPTSGETQANTPFPRWRCIAQALLADEPAEQCNGLINRSSTEQSQHGVAAQLEYDGPLFGRPSQSLLGAAYDSSRSRFRQSAELGYLNPDRSITGVGAYADGVSGGSIDGQPYDTRVDLAGRTRIASVFGSTVWSLARQTHLTLAARYNDVRVRNRDAIQPGGGTGSLDGDYRYRRLNPALGLNFVPAPGLQAYVGANQGSRAPSAVELGCADPASPCKLPNAFAGDPPLKQVVTTTLEAGVRGGERSGWSWGVSVFRSDNRDDLLFVADDAAGFGYFRNFGRTRRQGLELESGWRVSPRLTLGGNLTLLDATFRSAEVVDGSANSSNSAAQAGTPGLEGTIAIRPGDRIPLVPRQMLKLYAEWQPAARWQLGADLVAMGGATARGNENGAHQPDGVYYLGPGRSPGYAVLNLNAAFEPAHGWNVFVQLNNALDKRYSTAAQLAPAAFNANGAFQSRPLPANADGDYPQRNSTFQAPGAPRSVWVGLKRSFGA